VERHKRRSDAPPEDIAVTDQLVQAGRQLASELGDHRISGKGAMLAPPLSGVG